MNIISGKARRILLTVPKGMAVRPTSVRARKALFDSLGDFSGANVVDLFSGSGSLGLEAASRGAAKVVMVENLPQPLPRNRRKYPKSYQGRCRFRISIGNRQCAERHLPRGNA